jgi:hypothetical protein
MNAAEAWQNIEAHLKADYQSVKARVELDLPEVASAIADAASNPVTQALAAAVHLPEVPEAMTLAANFIAGLDAAIGAAKAQASAGTAESQPAQAVQ